MSRYFEGLRFVAPIILLMLASGCGDKRKTLGTEYVEGTVTVDGKPVAEATVTFIPVKEGEGTAAVGLTDANGVYKLTATVTGDTKAEPGAGTTPGEYYVGVTKSTTAAPSAAHGAEVKYESTAGKNAKLTHEVPEKYNLAQKSGLKVTVTEGENKIPLELKSK